MRHDLTEGNVTKSLLLFALPMILGNLLQQCYNLADTFIVGRFLGVNALSSVGSAFTLMTFLNSFLTGMCMGAGALFSYYQGRKDERRRIECIDTAFVILSLLALILTAGTELLLSPLLYLLRIPSELDCMMREYLVLIFLGIFFVYLYNYFTYLLRSLGDSVLPIVFLAISSLLNIALDLVFVAILSWGIRGAAAATLLSQALSGLGLGFVTWRRFPDLRFSLLRYRRGRKPLRELMRYSLASSAQQSVMNFGILLMQGLVNSFGVAVMAAYTAVGKITGLAYMPAQETANAFSIFLSQNYGAGKKERMREGTRTAVLVTMLLCLTVSAIVNIIPRILISVFISPDETLITAIGIRYMRIEGSFYCLIGLLFLLYAFFRGTGRPEISLLLSFISLGTRVLLAYIAAGLTGTYQQIWWVIPIGWALADASGIFLARKSPAII